MLWDQYVSVPHRAYVNVHSTRSSTLPFTLSGRVGKISLKQRQYHRPGQRRSNARARRQDAEYHWSVDCVKKPTVSVPLECTPRAWTVRSRSMDTLGSRIFVTARLDGVKHGPLTQFQRISFSCG